ncbi:hypothetical protein CANCADRAFT_4501 [Tortispora caseinolytica NRRL Y-17796]|uniref:Dienelactone hydrolase domain-containing protein n=1 Tax=Tortispora caseinolytica NRRL Y-17796 TaxID=767744 RepID=A0A1E4T9P0_9ASCO|nr:hypothetical protein CANCADRAFT_4501 [Tortispora caseinolytica NRRL Y-17796]
MASLPPGQCCGQGYRYTGETKGTVTEFAGVETYLAGDPSKTDKVILILTDVVGPLFTNVQLIADQFAEQDYYVVVPDMFNKDPVPLNHPNRDLLLKEWFPKHGPETVYPIIDAVIKEINEKLKPKYFVGVGYCFGCRFLVHLQARGILDATVLNHPSFVQEDELANIKSPISIQAAQIDEIFPTNLRHKSEEILIGTNQPFEITLYSHVSHGFAVRGDPDHPREKFARKQAFCAAVEWFAEFAP